MRFVIFVIDGGNNTATPGEGAAIDAFNDRLRAGKHLILAAARKKDSGQRADIEAGMAKLYATESCQRCAEEAMRIFGGYGYSTEYEVERLYRDAPLMMIGEGSNEIQETIIAKGLLKRYELI